MFTCYLCSQETVYTSYFCSACSETRRIFSLYGAKECRDILKRVCIREPQQRNYKISAELKSEIENQKVLKTLTKQIIETPKKTVGDETYKKRKKDLV